jgi:hypothetical protein
VHLEYSGVSIQILLEQEMLRCGFLVSNRLITELPVYRLPAFDNYLFQHQNKEEKEKKAKKSKKKKQKKCKLKKK